MSEATTTTTRLNLERTIKAPVAKVFAAWTEPAQLSKWWHCAPHWTTEVAEVDLQVGGKYRLGMQDPEKDFPHVVHGEFKEIDAPNRLVYTWEWEEPSEHPGQSLVTVEFIDQSGSTHIRITHEGFDSGEATTAHNKGWEAVLAMFDTLWTLSTAPIND